MKKIFFLVLLLLICSAMDLHAQAIPAIDTVRLNALAREINAAMQSTDYAKAATLIKELISLGENTADTYFSAAAPIGLSGDKAGAIAYLDTAAQKGWADMSMWNMMINSFGIDKEPQIAKATAIVKQNEEKKSVISAADTISVIHKLFLADQEERKDLLAKGGADRVSLETGMKLMHNDSLRREQIYLLMKDKKLSSAQDFGEAALILQHGTDTMDYRNAHELALASVKLGNEQAKWLAAATLDRYLVAQKKPQKYGTQSYVNKKTGKHVLYPVDPKTTDAERAEWNVPPLKDALKLIEKMYEKK